MSERDELAYSLDALEVTTYADGDALTPSGAKSLADTLIAWGYQRIPDDCVVVEYDDVEFATERIYEYADMLLSLAEPYDDPDEVMAIRKRLKAALTATRHGEDG